MNLRGRFRTDADGRFWFTTVKPAGYPVPTHGPMGEMCWHSSANRIGPRTSISWSRRRAARR